VRTHAQKFLLRLARGRRHKDSVAGTLALASPAGGAGDSPTAASAERGDAPAPPAGGAPQGGMGAAAAAGAHPAAPSGTAAGGQQPPARGSGGSTLTPPLCAAPFAAGAPARDVAHKLLGPRAPHARGKGPQREDWGVPPFLPRQFLTAAVGPDAGGARWLPGRGPPAARAGLGPEYPPPLGAGAAFDAGGGGVWSDGVPAGMRWDGADARAGGGGFAGEQAERAAERSALEREDERQSLAFLVGREEREWDDARAEGGAPEGWECGWPAQAQAQRGAFQ
jgi:hypothetical protein